MFKIAVYIVSTLALAQQVSIFAFMYTLYLIDSRYIIYFLNIQYSYSLVVQFQSYGLSKCYAGVETSKGKSQLKETDCSTDCVRTSIENDDGEWVAQMACGKKYINLHLQW